MTRTLLASIAGLMLAVLGFGAAPAAAYVGDYDFSDRGTARGSARTERNATQPRTTRQAARSTTRSAALPSLTGGGLRSSGIASYYWQPQRVASGGWFNPNAMTAAHKTLPFGTRVLVTNLNNGRSVTVRINDRGPYIQGRVIDLSRAAAKVVGMTGSGIARVNMAVLGR